MMILFKYSYYTIQAMTSMIPYFIFWGYWTILVFSITYDEELFPILNCKIIFRRDGLPMIEFQQCESIEEKDHFQFKNWSKCSERCCKTPLSQGSNFSEQALDKCKQQNQQEEQKFTLKIIMIVLAMIFGIFICLLFVRYACKQCKKHGKIYHQHIVLKRIKVKRLRWFALILEDFEKSQEKINLDDSSCSICLERYPNVRTPCGHHFHERCLKYWMQRSAQCPLCRGQIKQKLKIYCSCRVRYAFIPPQTIKGPIYEIEEAVLLCKDCNETLQAGHVDESNYEQKSQSKLNETRVDQGRLAYGSIQ